MRLLSQGGMGPEGLSFGASNVAGSPRTLCSYWFSEHELTQIKIAARGKLEGTPTDRNTALALAERMELRDKLAVSRDWTSRFDSYVRLALSPSLTLVGLVGPVKAQQVYSNNPAWAETAMKAGIPHFPGGATQYAVRLDFGPNQAAARSIGSPQPL